MTAGIFYPEDFGTGVGTGADDIAAFTAAFAAAGAVGGVVQMGVAKYNLYSSVTLPINVSLLGMGRDQTWLQSHITTGTALDTVPLVSHQKIADFTLKHIGPVAPTTKGLVLRQARACLLSNFEADDFDTGIHHDGETTFGATTNMVSVGTGRCRIGMRVTKTNNLRSYGGYFWGSAPIHADATSIGLWLESGGTCAFFGPGVENYYTAYRIDTVNSGGHSLYSPRHETCVVPYQFAAASPRIHIFDPCPDSDALALTGVNPDHVVNYSMTPQFGLDHTFLTAPDGSKRRLLVDNGGLLSTVPA